MNILLRAEKGGKGEWKRELRGGTQSGVDLVPLIFIAYLRPRSVYDSYAAAHVCSVGAVNSVIYVRLFAKNAEHKIQSGPKKYVTT